MYNPVLFQHVAAVSNICNDCVCFTAGHAAFTGTKVIRNVTPRVKRKLPYGTARLHNLSILSGSFLNGILMVFTYSVLSFSIFIPDEKLM